MDDHTREMFDKIFRSYAEREAAWWKQSRRGRWVVLEPGVGRLLKNSPRHVRDLVDAITEQRGRRFSSLSRARAFAREVGGEVRRWRRWMPSKGPWRLITNPWARVAKYPPLYFSDASMFAKP